MPVTMPSLYGFVTASNFYLETNTQIFESPINKTVQTLALSGARWKAEITLRRMKPTEAAQWIAFFLACRGMSDTFQLGDPNWPKNYGVGTGSPVVNGAGQTGTSLNITGATANITNWLRAGDYFSVNGELKRLVAPCNTNGSGQTTLLFEPPLRNSPSNSAVITVNNPTAKMRLSDDMQQQWLTDFNGIYQEKTFSCFESIP